MALSQTQRLIAELTAKGNLPKFMQDSIKSFDKLDRKIGHTQGLLNSPRWSRAGSQIGAGIKVGAAVAAVGIAALSTQVAIGLRELVELEKETAQTNAVIKSTGGIAGITAVQVRNLAEKYEALNAVIDDKVIQSAQNLLLTFPKITKDAFEPALAVILDMNTALGGGPEGLQTQTIAVGKALSDPIRGLTSLRRVGVIFTKEQEKMIKALVETGDVMGAQKIILGELNREFGGSFLAQGGTTAGNVAKFQDSIEDLQKALATALLPTVSKVADKLSTFLARPEVIKGAEDLGKSIAGLFSDKNIDAGARLVTSAFNTIRDVTPTAIEAFKIAGSVVKTAIDAFKQLPPEIQKLAIAGLAVNKLTGGLVTNIAGGLISSVLKQLVSGVVNVAGGVVNVTGGVPGAPIAPGGKVPPPAPGGVKLPAVGAAVVLPNYFNDPVFKGEIDDIINSVRKGSDKTGQKLADLSAGQHRMTERLLGQLTTVASATGSARDAIERKRLSVKVTNPVTVNVRATLSHRNVENGITIGARYSPGRSYMV